MGFQTVGIVGVGLIGGSFALALREAGFAGRIVGVSSAKTVTVARERGVIDDGLELEEAARAADLLYLARPVSRILEDLGVVAEHARAGCLVTDAGSTKGAVVARAQQAFVASDAQFLGGHPMAGKAASGVAAAEAGLFRGAPYVLTPAAAHELETEPAQVLSEWIGRIGARAISLPPGEHDEIVAFTSHLPQLAATALSRAVDQNVLDRDGSRVAGGGLRDMTRLAESPYEMWRDIFATNAGPVGRALDRYIEVLGHLREQLTQPGLAEEFRHAADWKTRFDGGSGPEGPC